VQRGGQHRSTDHPDRIRTDLGAGRAPRKSRKHEIEGQETSRRPRTLLIASGGPAYPRRLRQAPWAAPQWGRLKAGSPSRLRLTAFPTDQSIKRPLGPPPACRLPSAISSLSHLQPAGDEVADGHRRIAAAQPTLRRQGRKGLYREVNERVNDAKAQSRDGLMWPCLAAG